jgi:threonine dehydrogenase-like Zn-dependent dehydrogenase
MDQPEPDIPETMQAVIARGRGFENLQVAEVPVPDVGPDQLLARVDAAGVCTSIIKLIAQGEDHTFLNGWDMQRWPIVLGDEGAVTLVRAGDNLRGRYRTGERFAIQPAVHVPPIRHRERYRNEARDMHRCAVGYTLGGHLAQYILIQEEVLEAGCLLPLPDQTLPHFAASMAEPISCVVSAQERNYHILKDGPHAERQPLMGLLPGGVTVVIGAGAMGRIHAELALRFSPAVLIVTDLEQGRLARTRQTIGSKAQEKGTRLLCVSADELQNAVRDASDGGGADDVILAVGINAVQQQALELLGEGGVANLFGGLPRGKHILSLDAIAVHYNEIKVVGSSGGDPSDMAATLKAIAQGDIDPGNYVAAVGSLDNAIDVLRMIEETRIDGKAILYPHIRPTPLRMTEHWDTAQEESFLAERRGR